MSDLTAASWKSSLGNEKQQQMQQQQAELFMLFEAWKMSCIKAAANARDDEQRMQEEMGKRECSSQEESDKEEIMAQSYLEEKGK